jgi:hypothetical protein
MPRMRRPWGTYDGHVSPMSAEECHLDQQVAINTYLNSTSYMLTSLSLVNMHLLRDVFAMSGHLGLGRGDPPRVRSGVFQIHVNVL